MSRSFWLASATLLALAGGPGLLPAVADPASSEATAWAPLPADADSPLRDPLERRGQAVFRERCAACHAPIPATTFGPPFLPPMPGTQALQARYQGAVPAALEERSNLTPEFVRTIVRNGLPAMPFFRPTEVSDEDLDAVAAYLSRPR